MPRARWEALARKRAKRGLKTKYVSDEVELFDHLWYSWDGFEELAMSREYRSDGAPLGLLHSEIRCWLELNLIRDDLRFHDYYRHIKILDITWLAETKKRRKKAQPDGNSSGSSSRRNVRGFGKSRRRKAAR